MDAVTSDCYEGTTCLINKLDIRDEKQLSMVEADITFAKVSALEQNSIEGNFDIKHYKAIHSLRKACDSKSRSKKGLLFLWPFKTSLHIAYDVFKKGRVNQFHRAVHLSGFVSNRYRPKRRDGITGFVGYVATRITAIAVCQRNLTLCDAI